MTTKLERDYQTDLIRKLRRIFPSAVILKNDSEYLPGIPDLSIFYYGFWAMLEVKASAISLERPNQDHYVRLLNDMSFAAFIYPENEEEVLGALQSAYESYREARVPQPQ
jgi:hypothetical protein